MTYQNPHGPGCFWHSYAENHGAPNIKWCEETLCHVVSEPANTWSNLGYMAIALYVIYLAQKKNHNFEMKQFGPIIFFMGAMSFFYHQSNYYHSQILDFVGMFFFVGWAIGMNFIRLGWMNKNKLIPFNVALALIYTACLHYMYLTGLKFQGIVLISGFLIIATEIKARDKAQVHYKYFTTTIGILITAFAFSIADGQRLWCDPTAHGWFSQGHALWHWVASLGMLSLYLHYAQPALINAEDEDEEELSQEDLATEEKN